MREWFKILILLLILFNLMLTNLFLSEYILIPSARSFVRQAKKLIIKQGVKYENELEKEIDNAKASD